MRQIEEAREIQESIDKNKKLPKKFRIDNVLVDVTYSFQTKLQNLMNNNHRETLRFLFIYVNSCGSIRYRSSTESEFYYIGSTAFLEIRIFYL